MKADHVAPFYRRHTTVLNQHGKKRWRNRQQNGLMFHKLEVWDAYGVPVFVPTTWDGIELIMDVPEHCALPAKACIWLRN